ncbi:CaiB/BaiF CoA-transferase family protein [Sphingopyxis sp. GW247-27LB]|uniref:CaiB/BaiF CoA transferase family protein n=1 Tax=Sphingopyxis sp. GW247-27LB TaxID=2012632 RepID=UPI000BA644DF|nr:CaiB/BaiF CoA-transferase family protein [Sphingopyxis sp. GW247-27LB]PAL24232.1 carnitine dehydratase [Sphingopyxis sp. GW247-27LB]
MAGPLAGVRIIEIGSIGPGPFAAMMLADHGADVIRIQRPGVEDDSADALLRSRKTLELDLKTPAGVAALRSLVREADGLIEGFRPGTMERLGLGPDILLADNPRLIFGRMTGWGQTGPYSAYAGHDINYISLSGALHAIGTADRPVPPLALVGDFGGGGMLLAFSITAAILNSRSTGKGQVIDCAMSEGSGLLMTPFYSGLASGWWHDRRAANVIDGGTHFYGVYETSDGLFVSIGSIEPQFYALLLERLGLSDDADFARQLDEGLWPALRARLESIFRTRTRDEWCALMEHSDICFAPVLSLHEAPRHRHSVERGAFVDVEGVVQPAPAPRYSVTPLDPPVRSVQASMAELGLALPGAT